LIFTRMQSMHGMEDTSGYRSSSHLHYLLHRWNRFDHLLKNLSLLADARQELAHNQDLAHNTNK
jgi:hypothetical protein